MKNIVALCIMITFLAGCASVPKQDATPTWFLSAEKEYPSSKYIRAVGEGSSATIAKNAAIAEISLYFDAKTDMLTTALQQSAQVIRGDEVEFSEDKALLQIVNISSSADFFCVNFTDTYFDATHENYAVLAYIDKSEAAQIYTIRINALLAAIAAHIDYAHSESEPFLAAAAFAKAETLSVLAEKYIQAETTIVSADTEKYKSSLADLARLSAERIAMKKEIDFSITLNQEDSRYNSVFTTIAQVLEKRGYAYSVSDARYKIVIDILCAFIRPVGL